VDIALGAYLAYVHDSSSSIAALSVANL
jgi:hypothetical protein